MVEEEGAGFGGWRDRVKRACNDVCQWPSSQASGLPACLGGGEVDLTNGLPYVRTETSASPISSPCAERLKEFNC